jgi:hypothetical protein
MLTVRCGERIGGRVCRSALLEVFERGGDLRYRWMDPPLRRIGEHPVPEAFERGPCWLPDLKGTVLKVLDDAPIVTWCRKHRHQVGIDRRGVVDLMGVTREVFAIRERDGWAALITDGETL